MSDKICVLSNREEVVSELLELLNFVGYEIFLVNSVENLNMENNFQIILVYSSNAHESFTWIKKIKTNSKLKDIPIILIVKKKEYNILFEAYQIGISDFIELPVVDIELISKVALHIELKKNRERIENLYAELKNSLSLATNLQKFMLPPEISLKNCLWFTSSYLPAQIVGGDIYDYFEVDGKVFGYIADISGHGIQSALLCSAIKSAIRSSTSRNTSITDIVNELYEGAKSILANNYLTGIFFKIDLDGSVEYINCGHPSVIVYDGKDFYPLDMRNTFPIGLIDYTYSIEDVGKFYIEKGKAYLLYSDGLYSFFEKRYPNESSHKLLFEFLKREIAGVPSEILPFYIENIIKKLYAEIPDDYSVVCFGKNEHFCFVDKERKIMNTSSKTVRDIAKKLEQNSFLDDYAILCNEYKTYSVFMTKGIEIGHILKNLPMSISLSFGEVAMVKVFYQ